MKSVHLFSYRKDIDGLRALAILLVVLFHSGVGALSGGFIGVDVFFVISGFLIGSIISREISNNTFTFYQFYVRRIRRIAPALFFMLFCITALSYSILSPLEFRDLAKYVTAVLLFVPNVMLLKGIDYFNPDADLNPMLMTWSLGIEEQFYFVLPALMIIAHRLRFSLKAVIVTLSLASLVAGIIITPINGNSAFYLLHTRAWELGAGVLLALWRNQPVTGSKGVPLTLAGLLLILLPVFFLDKESAFPGFLALMPVVGAVLIILTHNRLHQTLLENPLMVFIGKVSYSWYLWHWPLLSLARISANDPLSVVQGLSISAGALLIATFSWYFVEKPFRRPAQPQQRIITSYAILCVVGILSFVSIYMTGGLKYRVNDLVNNGELFKVEAETNPCLLTYGANLPSTNSLCMPAIAVPAVALVGDSHAAALRSAVAQYALKNKKSLFQMTKSSCPFLIGSSRYMLDHPEQGDQCTAFNKEVMKTLLSDKVDEVVITAFWSSGFSLIPGYGYRSIDGKQQDNYLALDQGLGNAVKLLRAANKKVTIVEDVPSLDIDPLRYSITQNIPLRAKINAWLSNGSGVNTAADRTLRFHLTEDKVNKILGAYAQPGVKVLNLKENLCSQKGCLIASKGLPLYYDTHHLTDLGSSIALGNNL